MTYLSFLMVLFLAGGIAVVARMVGVRARFEPTFKALAISLSTLPVLVMSAIVVFGLQVVAVAAALLVLHFAGVIPDLSKIPHRYEILGLWVLIALALGISGINWVRHILVVRRENE